MKSTIVHKMIRYLWLFTGTVFLFILLFVAMVRYDIFGWFGGLPSLDALEQPDPDLSSELISADGDILGKYFRKNRTPASYDDLSPELIRTLLVTEDIRFHKHAGIDFRGLMRAILGKLTFSFRGGGSTLTMQLAENLYGTSTDNRGSLYKYRMLGGVITKFKEWIISYQLEKAYTKEEIMAMYLNTIEFGSNAYGIKVAAKTFFNKEPSELGYAESAILVGLINAPTRWNPVLNPDNAYRKRTEILHNLYKYDYLSRQTFDSLTNAEIVLDYRVANQNQGMATYFRKVAGNELRAWCEAHGYDLYEDGLKIYTTLDARMQKHAEAAVKQQMATLQGRFNNHWGTRNPWIDENGREIKGFLKDAMKRTPAYKYLSSQYNNADSIEYYLNQKKKMKVFSWDGEVDTTFSSYDSLKYYKRFLHAGFIAIEPQTGHIKAWVGGIDHKYFKYDHVRQGKRQPGSTFKPFVYTEAIRAGYSPCYRVKDVPTAYTLPNGDIWAPENSDGPSTGENLTLRQAMARSVNTITAYIGMNFTSPEAVVDQAKRMGIQTDLQAVPSMFLGGGSDVSLLEMAGAYGTFVNKGLHTRPHFITKIEDKNGNIIESFIPEQVEALSERDAYIMLHMLKGATEEKGGTALGLAWELRNNNDVGAKTGTTQNASDGWFMGVTHDLVAGAWVGGDDRSIHFRNWALGQGAKTALPIWEIFMTKVYKDESLDHEKGRFAPPSTPLGMELDCEMFWGSGDPDQNDVVDQKDIRG